MNFKQAGMMSWNHILIHDHCSFFFEICINFIPNKPFALVIRMHFGRWNDVKDSYSALLVIQGQNKKVEKYEEPNIAYKCENNLT